MTGRTPKLVFLTAGTAIVGACHQDSLGAHGCPVEYSAGWSGRGLDLEHTVPDKCPVFISSAGEIKETGALLIDGGTPEFEEAYLNVKDFSGDPVGLNFVRFQYSTDGRWSAPVFASYSAGRDNFSPDQARFQLTYKGGSPGPDAMMRITYTNAVSASIGGPGTVYDGTEVTFTADVATGQAPFTYRWYRDWDLVGTGSTYTDYWGGSGNVDLRLDVIDARGEADSHQKNITVSSCPEGQREC